MRQLVVEQRRSKRFEIRLPVRLVRNGVRLMSESGETRNLSSGGVLFATDAKMDIGEPIEYVIGLTPAGDVDLHCLGKVIRLDPGVAGWPDGPQPFEVAATLERYEFVRQKLA
ncbi:MAG: PilZ domain-containing protein [Bryobacteraceae bacterium]